MQKMIKRDKRITEIPIVKIRPAIIKTRKDYSESELRQLAESISQYGVIEPAAVRRVSSEEYEMIAGERRLRAASIAGLKKIPCIIYDLNDRQAALVSMIKNLHRTEPDCFETADALNSIIRQNNLTVRECGSMLAVMPSDIYELLNMLQLSDEDRQTVNIYGLTEGHIKAALRIENEADRRMALGELIESGMNVGQFEHYIDTIISERGRTRRRNQKNRLIIKNIKLFENTISRAADTLRMLGINVITGQRQAPGYVEYVIRIPVNTSAQFHMPEDKSA